MPRLFKRIGLEIFFYSCAIDNLGFKCVTKTISIPIGNLSSIGWMGPFYHAFFCFGFQSQEYDPTENETRKKWKNLEMVNHTSIGCA